MINTMELGPVTNGAKKAIESGKPYRVEIELTGSSDLLFHRWNVEEVEAKSKSKKGSAEKRTDNLESYVYRNDTGDLCLPTEYIRQSIIWSAKYHQDPRSPRKSAMDLYKAGIACETDLCSLGKGKWDFEDKRRVVIQRNGITRTRPGFKSGWKCKARFFVLLPEYIAPQEFHEILNQAGRIVGVGDFRPTYGRFNVTLFKVFQ